MVIGSCHEAMDNIYIYIYITWAHDARLHIAGTNGSKNAKNLIKKHNKTACQIYQQMIFSKVERDL